MSPIALITGANKGIGFEIARQLGRRGMSIIIAARDPQRGSEAAARLKSHGIDARSVVLDVTNQDTIGTAAREVEAAFGKLDVLVNNAGIQIDGGRKPSEVSPDTLRRTYETNVFGPVAVTQAFLPLLKKSDAGRSSTCRPAWGRSRRTATRVTSSSRSSTWPTTHRKRR